MHPHLRSRWYHRTRSPDPQSAPGRPLSEPQLPCGNASLCAAAQDSGGGLPLSTFRIHMHPLASK